MILMKQKKNLHHTSLEESVRRNFVAMMEISEIKLAQSKIYKSFFPAEGTCGDEQKKKVE